MFNYFHEIYIYFLYYFAVSRVVVCTNSLERHFFLAPDGSSYSGRKQAVDFMRKQVGNLRIVKKGDRQKAKVFKAYLPLPPPPPPPLHQLQHHLTSPPSPQGYPEEHIKIMEAGFKIQWIDEDPSLPQGWKTRSVFV